MTTDTDTNREICTSALRKLGVIGLRENPPAAELELARKGLGRLLKAWQLHGNLRFATARQSVALTTAASYTMSPVRPIRVDQVNFKVNGIETPMQRMTREEYDNLPQKGATGQPTAFYYDRQREAALLYVWPVLASASGQTLEVTYQRELSDVDLDDPADIPGEWYDAAVYGLAARLADNFSMDAQRITARAEEELRLALANELEGSVYFTETDNA